MTESQKNKCHAIIHTGSIAAGAGNLSPVPGTGFAADMVALTTMACALAAVFGKDLPKSAAKAAAIAALKKTLLKQPLKAVVKEAAKIVPWAGQAVSASIGVAIAEAAGWSIAFDLDKGNI